MSVMVATALSGIVGLMVIRLMSNQAEAMLIVKLREEREILVKHYRQVVIGGWDKTMASTGTSDPTTSTSVLIRDSSIGKGAFPLSLRSDPPHNLYTHNANGWWKVEAKINSLTPSGQVQHSDDYDSRGLATEKNYSVTLTIDFDPKKHPVVKMDLATRQEEIYMGYRWQQTKQTGCGSDSNTTTLTTSTTLTRQDTKSGTPKPLYHPDSQGAVVSYSFHSNYIKCSQVPLVSVGNCPAVGAILGFESRGTGTSNPFYRRAHNTNEYVTGRLACSFPVGAANTPEGKWKAALANNRYYTLRDKVWDNRDTANTSARSGLTCPSIDKSYLNFVTSVTTGGAGGGELVCEPMLIAPQTRAASILGAIPSAINGRIDGCTVNANGTTICPTGSTYRGWNPAIRSDSQYRYHGGGGGYLANQGFGIKSIGHSGGIKEFNSRGLIVGTRRRHPILADNRLRGRPGSRGRYGDCSCKEGDEQVIPACTIP